MQLIRHSLVRFRFHQESKTASNVALQRREAMEIRLGYATNGMQRPLMRGIGRANALREKISPFWPEIDR